MPGFVLSEADVIRSIYRMSAGERQSCFALADFLNRLGIPCAYTRDGRELLRGKRQEKTSGLWRPGRVRNLIVSKTYMGRHEYGKRSKNKDRNVIVRDRRRQVRDRRDDEVTGFFESDEAAIKEVIDARRQQ